MVKGVQEPCAKSPAAETQQSFRDFVRIESTSTTRRLGPFSFYHGFPSFSSLFLGAFFHSSLVAKIHCLGLEVLRTLTPPWRLSKRLILDI